MAADALRVFPNPTNGQLELRFPGQQIGRIELFALAGKRALLVDQRFTDAASLDLSRLPNGLYLLKTRQDGGVIVRRIVLQR